MFSNFSWSEYLFFIAILSLVYYAVVLYTYYRHDFLIAIKRNQFSSPTAHVKANDSTQSNITAAIIPEDNKAKGEEAAFQSLLDEVRAYLEEKSQTKVEKSLLLQDLDMIAGKYPSLAESIYKESIEEFIANQVEMNCAVSLSEEELRGIWNKA